MAKILYYQNYTCAKKHQAYKHDYDVDRDVIPRQPTYLIVKYCVYILCPGKREDRRCGSINNGENDRCHIFNIHKRIVTYY